MLITGRAYRFYVVAENYAGKSPDGAIAIFYACISPQGMGMPFKGTVTSIAVEVLWADPTYDGGCRLSSF